MSKEKTHRLFMFFALLLSVFIFIDCTFFPQSITDEIIQQKNRFEIQTGSSNTVRYNYEIITNKSKHDVTKWVYNCINENDSVKIYYSTISHAIQKIQIKVENDTSTFQNNYLNVSNGIFFLLFLGIGSIIAQFVYHILPYEVSKRNIGLLCLTFSFLVLFFYLWS